MSDTVLYTYALPTIEAVSLFPFTDEETEARDGDISRSHELLVDMGFKPMCSLSSLALQQTNVYLSLVSASY